MELIERITVVVSVALLVLGSVVGLWRVDKPRKPVTRGVWLSATLINLGIIYLLIKAYFA